MRKSIYYPFFPTTAHPACIALALVLGITACAALLLIAGAATTAPPHHAVLFAELQRLSAQLERTQHQHREGIDGVGQRLEDLHAAVGVLVEVMGRSEDAGTGREAEAETDIRLKPTVQESMGTTENEVDEPVTGEEDEEEAVIVE